jgi:RimJ/RimL family protein N-acetyltransferase
MYKCLSKKRYDRHGSYAIVPIRQEDMETIRLWRNSQIAILRQNTPISQDEQKAYFDTVIAPSFLQDEPKQILFSFLKDDLFIGYGGLTHIDWHARRAELSFLLNPSITDGTHEFTERFFAFVEILTDVAFSDINLHRLFAETYEFRKELITLLEELGFQYEGRLKEHVFKEGAWHDSLLYGLLATPKEKAQSAVLVTSISKKVPLIRAVHSAIKKVAAFDQLLGADSDEKAPSQYWVDNFWLCPRLDTLSLEEVVSYCKTHAIKAIIPTRDSDLQFYAKHREKLESLGISVLVSKPFTINATRDKKYFAEYLSERGYPSIPTHTTIDELQTNEYVVKERFGAGSRGIGIGLSYKEAQKFAGTLEHPIFQPRVKGKEYSIDLYRDLSGTVKGCVARERTVVVQGESQITTTVRNERLELLCMGLANDLDLYGHACIQVIEDTDSKFHIVECNCRFGGASTASLQVGLDSFYWFLLEASGTDLTLYPFKRAAEEIRQIRYPADRVLFTW